MGAIPDLLAPVRTLMRQDPVCLNAEETIGEVLDRLRNTTLGERIVYFYVTDVEKRLVGVVPVRRLLLPEPSTRIREVMIAHVHSVQEDASIQDALDRMVALRLLALPVVDARGLLLGVIDLGILPTSLDPLVEAQGAEKLFQIAGVHAAEARRPTAFWTAFLHRFPWLLCNVAGGLVGAWLSGLFEVTLQKAVALAFFLPLLLTIAEGVAMQSLTVTLARFQVGGVSSQGIGREMPLGLLIGFGCAAAVAPLALLWLGQPDVALILLCSLTLAGLLGAIFGSWVPRTVYKLQLDPNFASGPAALALADITSLLAYLSVATLLLR